MKCNVGGADRIARAVAAVVFLSVAFFIELPGYWETVFLVLGFVAAFTALARYCPVNQAIGLNTCRRAGAP